MSEGRELWRRFCAWRVADPELGVSLDVSRVGFDQAWIESMRPAMTAGLEAMAELEAGAIANPHEQRRVGHYWLRAPQLAPDAATAQAIRDTIAAIRDFAAGVHGGTLRGADGAFRNLLHIGIGGSALGPQFVADALGGPGDRLRLRFLDNTDPDGIDRVLAGLDGELGRTLVTVASKSGGTPEPRNAMFEVEAAYERAGLEFAPHAVAITGPGSALDQEAESRGWLKRFPVWEWVGGRTSVMSAVGLVPAALQGVDVEAVLDGAAAMDAWTREPEMKRNPAALLALMWHRLTGGRGEKDMVIIPYSDRLLLLSRYLQQLVMESLGKAVDRDGRAVHQGITVYGNKGSTDQHAYVQQLREGVPNFFVTFVQVLREREGVSIEVEREVTAGDYLRGFLLGTRSALYEAGRESITIAVEALTPRTLGALIALYDRAVGLYAELINVNAYNQPGVEAGKKAAAEVLELQRRVLDHLAAAEGAGTADELAAAVSRPDEAETVYRILEHLAANPSRGVAMTPAETPAETRFRMKWKPAE